MADNLTTQSATPATIPASSVISTEEVTTLNAGAVSAQHLQRIATAIRTADGTAIDLPGDATNGLDADVTRVIPGTSATHLGKAVDSAAGSTDTGVAALAIRNDSPAGVTPADGDYVHLRTDNFGRLWAQVVQGDEAELKGSVGGLDAHDGAVSSNPIGLGGRASAAAPTNVSADNDMVRLWALLNGALCVNVTAAGALIGGDATNGIDCDVTRVIPGTSATHLGKAVDSAAGATDTGVAILAVRDDALSALTPAESDYVPLRTGANGALWVQLYSADTSFPILADGGAYASCLVVGFVVDDTTTTVSEGNVGAPRMTTNRQAIVTTQVHTAGGESSLSALSTAAVYTAEVKGSAGQIYGIEIFNKGAAAVYARLYNQTGAPASTDGANIIWRGIVPGNTAGAGFIKSWPNGKVCSTGIGIRVSGAIADNDTTVLAANEVTINVGYK